MNQEKDKRVAILSLFALLNCREMSLSGLGTKWPQITEIVKTFQKANELDDGSPARARYMKRLNRKRTAKFLDALMEKIHEDPGLCMAELSNDMGVRQSAVRLAVHKDLGYPSFVLSSHQVLKEHPGLTKTWNFRHFIYDIKHNCVGLLRFFSDQKNFIHDRNINQQNDIWCYQGPLEVFNVMHTIFPSLFMVLRLIHIKEDAMPHYLFEGEPESSTDGYIHVLKTAVKPFIVRVAAGRDYVFEKDSLPAHEPFKTQA